MTPPFIPSEDTTQAIAQHVEQLLIHMGEDPTREGLVRTPHRVGEAMQFLTQGYKQDPEAILRAALFEEGLAGNFIYVTYENDLPRDLIYSLSLENETELRTVKMFSNGSFKGMKLPEAGGLDVNNLFTFVCYNVELA